MSLIPAQLCIYLAGEQADHSLTCFLLIKLSRLCFQIQLRLKKPRQINNFSRILIKVRRALKYFFDGI